MIRKISKVITLVIVVGCLGFTVPAWGAEKSVMKPGSITYEMQDITVQYAAEFTAYPLSTARNSVSKSVYDAVYSSEAKPIQVLYGVVKLTTMTGLLLHRGVHSRFGWCAYLPVVYPTGVARFTM